MIAPIISCIVITSCFSLVALSAATDNTFLNHSHNLQDDKYTTTFKRIKEINGTRCNAFLPIRFASISSGISTKNSLKDISEGHHHSFYEVIGVRGDGNCFFRAIAFVMHGDQNLHYNVRQNIVSYLSQNWIQFPEGTITTGSKDFYLKLMSQSGEYATHIELICAAMLYKKSVYLYRYDNTRDCLIIDDKASVINPNYTGHISIVHTGAYDAGHYDVLAPMK